MKDKILLVDDEQDILEFLEYNLIKEGFEVETAANGKDALEKLSFMPDLIILDVMMPEMDGYELCKILRSKKEFERTPIIFLTAKSSELDEVKGLEIGADDYIQKPISPKKLIARVKSNLRRVDGKKERENNVIEVGKLKIDKERFIVTIEDKEIFFPKKEFAILAYLASKPGIVFPREKLLNDIWGKDVYVVERTVDVHVRKIREKLGEHSDLIETVKGVGYKFKN